MQGVTTALVAFIFFCVIFPERVKNRPQFYASLGLVCAILLLDALGLMISGAEGGMKGFRVFAYAAGAFLQVVAIITLFMAAGGLSWRDLKDEMGNAYEVIRRGGETKEVIVPLTGERPKRRDVRDLDDDDDDAGRIVIEAPVKSPPKPADEPRIPLD